MRFLNLIKAHVILTRVPIIIASMVPPVKFKSSQHTVDYAVGLVSYHACELYLLCVQNNNELTTLTPDTSALLLFLFTDICTQQWVLLDRCT